MTTNTFHPTPTFLDLTGLPDPVVQQVTKLVIEARNMLPHTVEPSPYPMFISNPNPSPEEFRAILDRMASLSSGQSLPIDFSRADIYDDHD